MTNKKIDPIKLFWFLCLYHTLILNAQETFSSEKLIFNSVQSLYDYGLDQSINIENNSIILDQTKKAKLAAVLGTIDVTGNLLSAQYTNNTKLGVNVFPAEIFGGQPGTFKEVEMGVQHTTNLTNHMDIKLINPSGWSNLKLAKIAIDLSESNNSLSKQELKKNIANSYYNIVNLAEQISSTEKNLSVLDTILTITQDKVDKGIYRQQELNTVTINQLNMKESLEQLKYLKEQYHLSLKILCDIPEDQGIIIDSERSPKITKPTVQLNNLNLKNAMLNAEYSKVQNNIAIGSFSPTLSLQLSNSNNLYNTEFQPLSGDWINSNYIGLRLNIPIPNSKLFTQKIQAKQEQDIAKNLSKKAENQAMLDQQQLQTDYEKARSQWNTNREIHKLSQDSYQKDLNLYKEGLISPESILNSYNTMVSNEYAMINAEVNLQLIYAKIDINNNIR
ncbi:MAG: TolC family protein [Flavobacteriales bacterium]|nr:TolC family protein [Flavobacteriales bacterium]